MKSTLLFLILVILPGASCLGQYTYFNERLQPGEYYYGGLVNNNLFEVDNELRFTCMLLENNLFTYSRADCSFVGQIANVTSINYTDSAEFVLPQGHTLKLLENNGYFQVGMMRMFSPFREKAHVMKMSENHELEWDFTIPGYEEENVIRTFYTSATTSTDQSYISVGTYYWDDNPPISNGIEAAVILTKLSPEGQLIWHREYAMDELFTVEVGQVMATGVFEMQNEDILVFGNYWLSTRPIVLRFDSSGNYLSYVSWGAPWVPGSSTSLDEAIANPVRTGENTFVIPYGYELSEPHPSGYIIHKFRLAVFDSQTMSVSLDDELEYADLELGIRDFVRTSDNGFAMLGQRTIMNFGNLGWESYQEAFLLKFDTNRQVEWLKTYQPIVPEDDPNWNNYGWFFTQDLLVTSDGGLAFLGEVMPYDQSELYAWLVKLDACGDVVYNGCPPVGVAENVAQSNLLLYPNPATNQLNIILPSGGNRAEVYSLSGQLVMIQFVYPGWDRAAFDVSGLPKGMYMVRVVKESGEVLGVGRFVRE